VDAKDPRLLYAGILDYYHFGLWASQDSGQTWQRRLRTVPDQLICDTQRSGTVYLLDFGILQRSRDQGVTWEAYFSGVGGAANSAALGLVFDPRHPWIAYVLSYAEVQSLEHPAALYKTDDDGAHWQPLTVGSPGNVLTNALAVSLAGTLLFSSDLPGGFYRSTDGGASWVLGGSGLINTGVVAVAFGTPGTFFASTGKGVSRCRLFWRRLPPFARHRVGAFRGRPDQPRDLGDRVRSRRPEASGGRHQRRRRLRAALRAIALSNRTARAQSRANGRDQRRRVGRERREEPKVRAGRCST